MNFANSARRVIRFARSCHANRHNNRLLRIQVERLAICQCFKHEVATSVRQRDGYILRTDKTLVRDRDIIHERFAFCQFIGFDLGRCINNHNRFGHLRLVLDGGDDLILVFNLRLYHLPVNRDRPDTEVHGNGILCARLNINGIGVCIMIISRNGNRVIAFRNIYLVKSVGIGQTLIEHRARVDVLHKHLCIRQMRMLCRVIGILIAYIHFQSANRVRYRRDGIRQSYARTVGSIDTDITGNRHIDIRLKQRIRDHLEVHLNELTACDGREVLRSYHLHPFR